MRRLRQFLRLKYLIRIGLIAILVWAAVIAVLASSIQRSGENGNAIESDVIIVLGSGLRRSGRPGDALTRRSIWGAGLYQQGLAERVICTGGIGEGHVRSEADACRELLLREGVPADAIFIEEQSHSTEENAIYAQEIMLENGWDSAVLVTDSFHMLRANWIFEDYFDDNNISHTRSPVPREWVRDYFYWRHFNREIVALHWQAFKETFNLPFTSVPG